MIHYIQGDIFLSAAQVLVNPVNCVGTIGKGLAYGFKQRFPKNYAAYVEDCRERLIEPGMVVYGKENGKIIANVATKDHWRNPSRYAWVSNGLDVLAQTAFHLEFTSLALPALGCGNGGLEWPRVKKLIEQHLRDLPFSIEVYEPHGGGAE